MDMTFEEYLVGFGGESWGLEGIREGRANPRGNRVESYGMSFREL